ILRDAEQIQLAGGNSLVGPAAPANALALGRYGGAALGLTFAAAAAATIYLGAHHALTLSQAIDSVRQMIAAAPALAAENKAAVVKGLAALSIVGSSLVVRNGSERPGEPVIRAGMEFRFGSQRLRTSVYQGNRQWTAEQFNAKTGGWSELTNRMFDEDEILRYRTGPGATSPSMKRPGIGNEIQIDPALQAEWRRTVHEKNLPVETKTIEGEVITGKWFVVPELDPRLDGTFLWDSDGVTAIHVTREPVVEGRKDVAEMAGLHEGVEARTERTIRNSWRYLALAWLRFIPAFARWQDARVRREAHIVAAATQMLAFGADNDWYTQSITEGMTSDERRAFIHEDRRYQHRVIRRHLGAAKLERIRDAENRLEMLAAATNGEIALRDFFAGYHSPATPPVSTRLGSDAVTLAKTSNLQGVPSQASDPDMLRGLMLRGLTPAEENSIKISAPASDINLLERPAKADKEWLDILRSARIKPVNIIDNDILHQVLPTLPHFKPSWKLDDVIKLIEQQPPTVQLNLLETLEKRNPFEWKLTDPDYARLKTTLNSLREEIKAKPIQIDPSIFTELDQPRIDIKPGLIENGPERDVAEPVLLQPGKIAKGNVKLPKLDLKDIPTFKINGKSDSILRFQPFIHSAASSFSRYHDMVRDAGAKLSDTLSKFGSTTIGNWLGSNKLSNWINEHLSRTETGAVHAKGLPDGRWGFVFAGVGLAIALLVMAGIGGTAVVASAGAMMFALAYGAYRLYAHSYLGDGSAAARLHIARSAKAAFGMAGLLGMAALYVFMGSISLPAVAIAAGIAAAVGAIYFVAARVDQGRLNAIERGEGLVMREPSRYRIAELLRATQKLRQIVGALRANLYSVVIVEGIRQMTEEQFERAAAAFADPAAAAQAFKGGVYVDRATGMVYVNAKRLA
ncbi:MAG TPA: hypothetical protein VMU17_02130, partial [Elusimicrobiota bacterium]|nr:hypothetical protein [Elusimicrobiota bacterium]